MSRPCDAMSCSMPAFDVLNYLPAFSQIHVNWVGNAIQSDSLMPSNWILCRRFLFLPSIFPSIRVFSNESILRIRWPKDWSFSFSISPSNEYSGLISFRDWLESRSFISLESKLLSRVFSSTTTWKHQFFGAQPSLWSNSHIYTWLLERPQLLLDGHLLAKWCLCFLICYLGLS